MKIETGISDQTIYLYDLYDGYRKITGKSAKITRRAQQGAGRTRPFGHRVKGVFIWRRAGPLCGNLASQLNSLSKFIFSFMYEKRASPPWRDLAIDYPRSRLGGLEIFHINALKRAGHS